MMVMSSRVFQPLGSTSTPGVAQPHRLPLLAVLADRAMQQCEDIAHALGHDPRDQLDPHLRGREHLRHRRRRLVLQRIGVEALGLLADAGAGFQLGIAILQHRIDRRGDIRHRLPVQPARLPGADHPAGTRHQEIVERVRARHALGDFDPRIVMQIEIVECAALERGLLPLHRHHKIGDRAAEEAVCHRHRRRRRKRDGIERRDAVAAVLAQDLALIAAGDDLIERTAALAFVIHAQIVLGDANQARRRIHPAGRGTEMLADGVACQRFDPGGAGVVAERPHLFGIEAFRDQLAFGPGDDLVEAVVAVGDAARATFDAEFFRRHAEHARLGQLAGGDKGHVVGDGRNRPQRCGR
ncbi:MAG: hypothetical protein ABI407_03065 [Bradyrhizobium sp.]